MTYETFEHTADLGLRVRAPDLDMLFAEAAQGLFSMVVTNLDDVRPRQAVTFEIASDGPDLLLFDWLSELLYTFEVRHLLLSRFDVQVADNRLTATARGEPLDRQRHQLDHEVKAITYHGLKVERAVDHWLAEVIVDV